MLRAQHKLPGVKALSTYLTSAIDNQDVEAAYNKLSVNLFHAAKLLGEDLQPVQPLRGSTSSVFDPKAEAAFRRIKIRAGTASKAVDSVADAELHQWEDMVITSFDAGVSMNLTPDTIQDQLIQELRALALTGRVLKFPSDIQAPVKRFVQYKGADGRIHQKQVDLALPANSRTITRLMDAWWQRKGGKPAGGKKVRVVNTSAGAAVEACKPQYRAMPITFSNAVEKLLYWEEQLLSALVKLDAEVEQLKASGDPMWFHPSRLTTGSQFATTSSAFRARQAALGVLAAGQHTYLGPRQAETARSYWDHSSVPGLDQDIPMWGLGLAGILRRFQESLGTGASAVYWHAKGYMDFGSPEMHDILPASVSGLCFTAITNLAHTVLVYLQPTSPADPVTKPPTRTKAATTATDSSSSDSDSQQHKPELSPHNSLGFCFPYGGLQYLTSHGQVTAQLVNSAVSGASFLGSCFEKSRGTTPPPANLLQLHNRPSLYSHRSMHAGEIGMLIRQLAKADLPEDLFDWYLLRAGRSEAAKSWLTYFNNYQFGFGPRLVYVRHAGQAVQVVAYKKRMFGWSPAKANSSIIEGLGEAEAASLKKAVQLCQLYSLNKTTPDIWQFIIDTVNAEGSFSGMLRKLTVPLMHNGYRLPKARAGCDWQYQHMSSAEADMHIQQLIDSIHANNAALYGSGNLPKAPARPVLLQTVACLLCADWDNIKLSFANPAAQAEAALAATNAAVASAMQAAAQAARYTAAGDVAAAEAANEAAANAAAVATQNAGILAAVAAPISVAEQSTQAAPAADETLPSGTSSAAGLAVAMPTAVPLPTAAAAELALDLQEASAVADGEGLESVLPSSPTAAVVAGVQQPMSAAAGAITLQRGAGLLLLLPDTKVWHTRAKSLGGCSSIRGINHSRYVVAQLMSADGLLLQPGFKQRVSVRLASEFTAAHLQSSGFWSKPAQDVDVWPGETLLLYEQPRHKLGKKFTGVAATHSYQALFDSFTEDRIRAVLGDLSLDRTKPPQRAAAGAAAAALASISCRQRDEVEQQPPVLAAAPAAAAADISGQAAHKQPLLSAALAAVTDLAMCEDAPAADAAFAAACSCIAGLLKGTAASGSAAAASSAGVKQDLQSVYMAVVAGEGAQPAVLQKLMGQLRKLASSSNVGSLAASSKSSGVPAAVPLALPGIAVTQLPGVITVPMCIDAEQPAPLTGPANGSSGGSSKRAAGVLSAGDGRPSKKATAPAEVREPPDWADSRLGSWVAQDWYLQLGDTVFMQVDDSCDGDPCTFFVEGSSAAGSVGSAAGAWVFRVESFESSASGESSMMARFYFNTQLDLQQPLLFKRKSQRLLLAKMQGIVHTLMPSSVNEVLKQLESDVLTQVAAGLWQQVDTD